MRKIKTLRIIVDIIWIISIVGLILVAVIGVYAFLSGGLSDNFKFNGIETSKLSKLNLFLIIFLNAFNLLIYYCIYLFREIVHAFDNLKVFSKTVIDNFNKIGFILILVGIINTVNSLLTTLVYEKFSSSFSLNWNTLGLVALGLFCSVLSEIFKISKNLKKENDLTI
ncbi:MAG: DUF2975 domain-containing protein [Flavobacteriaceae bacterium]